MNINRIFQNVNPPLSIDIMLGVKKYIFIVQRKFIILQFHKLYIPIKGSFKNYLPHWIFSSNVSYSPNISNKTGLVASQFGANT